MHCCILYLAQILRLRGRSLRIRPLLYNLIHDPEFNSFFSSHEIIPLQRC
jgi:hypothetical protein